MTVTIDPNIKKTTVRLDASGNIIDPKTKKVVEPVEEEYVPPEQGKTKEQPNQEDHVSTPSPLVQVIKEQVQAAVKDSIKDINIKEMVDQAIREAFK